MPPCLSDDGIDPVDTHEKKRACSHAICASTAKQPPITRSDREERERGRVLRWWAVLSLIAACLPRLFVCSSMDYRYSIVLFLHCIASKGSKHAVFVYYRRIYLFLPVCSSTVPLLSVPLLAWTAEKKGIKRAANDLCQRNYRCGRTSFLRCFAWTLTQMARFVETSKPHTECYLITAFMMVSDRSY